MRSTLEATLILTLSVVLTLLIMAVIFPRHAFGGGAPALQSPSIQPAVFVHGIHDRPGTAESPLKPGAAGQTIETACPYLAALAAASQCPASPEMSTTSACPYLLERQHRQLEPPAPPVKNLGQHT
jgi:hypothetical protein